MEYLKLIDVWFEANGPWLDALALFVVMAITLKARNAICLIVLLDFGLVYVGLEHLRNSVYWPDVQLDYHYVLGIKDIIIALILITFRAKPVLSLLYVAASMSCLITWYMYMVIYDKGLITFMNNVLGSGIKSRDLYNVWLYMFYAWSPIYFAVMVGQVYALAGDANDRRKNRNRSIHNRRRKLLSALHRYLDAYVAKFICRAKAV